VVSLFATGMAMAGFLPAGPAGASTSPKRELTLIGARVVPSAGARRTIAFRLTAQNATSTSLPGVRVVPGGLPPPVVGPVRTSPSALPASGGTLVVAGAVKHATACQLELLSHQSFAVVYAHSARPCTSSFAAHISVGPNPSQVQRTVAFALLAWNAAWKSVRTFYVRLAAPRPPTTIVATTTTTGHEPVTTTVPPSVSTPTFPVTRSTAPPSAFPQPRTSNNWSGYVVTGGPFTEANGTFTVSGLEPGAPQLDAMSEWVGIDGQAGTGGYQDLIQAGVLQSMEPCDGVATNPNGPYNPDKFYICPWTFFIENGQGLQGPLPRLTVKEGDSVSVEIRQKGGTEWAISMTDTTTGQTWSSGDQYYPGPGYSAEWIVEDPGKAGQPCGSSGGNFAGQCPLPAYSPAVSFNGLGLTPGIVSSWYEYGLVQGGSEVATPSSLRTNGPTVTGFVVSYTGLQASPKRVPAA
jgi:Peptidase A4 family